MAKILTQDVVAKLKSRLDIRDLLAEEFGFETKFGRRTINRWLSENNPNNKLTCKAALEIISKHLFIPEKNIYTDEPNDKRNASPNRVRSRKVCEANS